MENIVTKPDCHNGNAYCACVGYAYVPFQRLNDTFTAGEALLRGTLFPELELTMAEYGKVCKAGGTQ